MVILEVIACEKAHLEGHLQQRVSIALSRGLDQARIVVAEAMWV